MAEGSRIYSIGYATQPIERFIYFLKEHGVDVLVDVRSVPYSRTFYDFHKENLKARLNKEGIRYLYLGDLLGPRSPDNDMYDDLGQVQFDRLMETGTFLSGIERLRSGLEKGFDIALCCAEKEPAVCHRSLLISHHLWRVEQIDVSHIHYEGELEKHSELERRLMPLTGTETDLLNDEQAAMDLAYLKQCKRYAYTKPRDDGL